MNLEPITKMTFNGNEIPVMPYGCHNTKREQNYSSQDGWTYKVEGGKTPDPFIVQIPKSRLVENRMSTDCRYDRRTTDERCAGCEKM